MKKINFHYKEQSYSCGPAALRMILETLIDRDIPEELIIEKIGATPEAGASLSVFQKNLDSLLTHICLTFEIDNYFEYIIKENSSYKELQYLLDEGYLMMLNHKKPDGQAHWAVLNNLDHKTISLMDPEFGPHFKYELSQFNWTGGISTPTLNALIAIKYKYGHS